ncbi:MAG: hypothetical protein HY541_01760 [Deltaproteobacteria bacterium]|nr:hypothetical protein [Deltaproteobacteria bacterium]
MKKSKMLILILGLVFFGLPILAHAKFVLTGKTHPAVSPDDIRMSFYDRGQFKNCEEMGLVHSQNAFTPLLQTKKGMLERMKKQAAKNGVTDILMTQSKLGEFSGAQQGEGVAFYCPGTQKKK